jgi:hypothetical protein
MLLTRRTGALRRVAHLDERHALPIGRTLDWRLDHFLREFVWAAARPPLMGPSTPEHCPAAAVVRALCQTLLPLDMSERQSSLQLKAGLPVWMRTRNDTLWQFCRLPPIDAQHERAILPFSPSKRPQPNVHTSRGLRHLAVGSANLLLAARELHRVSRHSASASVTPAVSEQTSGRSTMRRSSASSDGGAPLGQSPCTATGESGGSARISRSSPWAGSRSPSADKIHIEHGGFACLESDLGGAPQVIRQLFGLSRDVARRLRVERPIEGASRRRSRRQGGHVHISRPLRDLRGR